MIPSKDCQLYRHVNKNYLAPGIYVISCICNIMSHGRYVFSEGGTSAALVPLGGYGSLAIFRES